MALISDFSPSLAELTVLLLLQTPAGSVSDSLSSIDLHWGDPEMTQLHNMAACARPSELVLVPAGESMGKFILPWIFRHLQVKTKIKISHILHGREAKGLQEWCMFRRLIPRMEKHSAHHLLSITSRLDPSQGVWVLSSLSAWRAFRQKPNEPKIMHQVWGRRLDYFVLFSS